jgi:hypothetical protein
MTCQSWLELNFFVLTSNTVYCSIIFGIRIWKYNIYRLN